MLGKGIVAAIVSRHSHDSAGAVACQYIFRNPDGISLTSEGVDGIAAGEHTRHLAVADAVALRALLHVCQIFIHG